MTRHELLLAILAAAKGGEYSPVQIQKAVFIVTRNLPQILNARDRFNFEPYDYGPFDSAVYQEIERLRGAGLAEIRQTSPGRWRTYSASPQGIAAGEVCLGTLLPDARDYVERVSTWVRSLDFATLVKSVYEAYPEMREKSIFRG